jgi:uncharacterized protein (TIGR02466 family)
MINPFFYKPFGPCIYSNLISADILNLLNDCKEKSKVINDNVGHLLAGSLESQLRLVTTEQEESKLIDHIFEHVGMYTVKSPEDVKKAFKISNKNIWLNIQKPGEFNPTHHHSGEISGIIYVDIPKEISEENKKIAEHPKTSQFTSHGEISFYYGEDISVPTYFHLMPITAQILLFPAKLKHSVHPFYSKVERVSIAFNIYDINDIKSDMS